MAAVSNITPLTSGPSQNEAAQRYTVAYGSHNIRAMNQVNAEILLVHQSRMEGFRVRTRGTFELDPVPRAVKHIMLADLVD